MLARVLVARIPAVVSKRLLILSFAAALLVAACSNPPEATVSYGSGTQFVPYVADNLDNAGLGNAIAVDANGVPSVSYLIFPAQLGPNEVPVPRPIGAPFIATTATGNAPSKTGAAVGVASVSADGTWTRGAAAQVQDTPRGIYIPYGPATVPSLIGAKARDTNGTDIAIDANGGRHVVWTGPDGVYYASGTDTFTFTQIYSRPPLMQAGPIGRPSVAVDANGVPWVAYTVDTATGQEVRVATKSGDTWTTDVVATIRLCAGCPQPGPTEIGVTPAGPIVVYVDGATGAVVAARPEGGGWRTETVQAGITASGPSLAVSSDGVPFTAYYTGDAVNLATPSGSGWATVKVADADPGGGTGNAAETTGVAVDQAGKVYVAWYDDTSKSVFLAGSSDGATFSPVATQGTEGAAFPSLGVTPDGSRIYLAWYDVELQDLLVGIQGSVKGLLVAQPSPTPSVIPSPSPSAATCSPTGTKLALVASGIAFDSSCLAVPAGKPFTISFQNEDAGIPHNVAIYSDSTSLFVGEVFPGPDGRTYRVPALDPGTYSFRCDVHPTQMFGTFIVK